MYPQFGCGGGVSGAHIKRVPTPVPDTPPSSRPLPLCGDVRRCFRWAGRPGGRPLRILPVVRCAGASGTLPYGGERGAAHPCLPLWGRWLPEGQTERVNVPPAGADIIRPTLAGRPGGGPCGYSAPLKGPLV